MKHISKLERILKQHFGWHKSRIDCFSQMLLALMVAQTVNLTKLAVQVSTNAKLENRYRRLQRFFSGCRIDYDAVARFIFWLFRFEGKKICLTLDRTNWKWGKKDINILCLGIVYKGVAIPIYWILLRSKGNSSTPMRIALIKRFIKTFGKANITGILGDREFVGKRWFGWMSDEKIPFYIRIKNDAITFNHYGKDICASWLFYHLKYGDKKIISPTKKIYGCQLYLTGARSPNGDLMMIVSNIKSDDAIEKYCTRWEIETLFQCLKGRGFHFEATHMTNRFRIKKLVVLLAIAFCWAHKVGQWQAINKKPIRIKKHGRPSKSIFRYGLDLIHDAMVQLVSTVRRIVHMIRVFEDPPEDHPSYFLHHSVKLRIF